MSLSWAFALRVEVALNALAKMLSVEQDHMQKALPSTAWLIECEPPIGDTLYFCDDGDWCNSPNHAHRFATAGEANAKRTTMQLGDKFRVAEHEWSTDSEASR